MSHGEDKDQLSAIYFLSNMAANDLDSFDIEVAAKSGILRSAFHASLVNCLERKNLRKIYIPAAEVVGRVLEMHRRTSNEQGLLDLLTQTLVKV